MQSNSVVVWTIPAATAAITVTGNVWMALVYSTILLRLGVLGSSATTLGWALFFSLLGLNNMLAMYLFARWISAHQREQAARAEVLAAMRWRNSPRSYSARIEEGFEPTGATPALAPYHLRYSLIFVVALVVPAALAGALALG